jgi:hypothetical protein
MGEEGNNMNLFTENSSLRTMNEIVAEQIPKYRIIGDLPLSKNDFNHLAFTIKYLYEKDTYEKIFNIYQEAFVVFIIFCGVYEYENNTFWQSIEKYIGEIPNHRRTEIYSTFLRVVKKYNLNSFENESAEGYTYVTPILCHAGIPISSFDSYFTAISNTVNDVFYDDFDVDDYLSYLENKTEMTVKRYIKSLEKRDAYNFIQDTKQLLLGDSIENDLLSNNGNYIRMMEQISLWMEKPKNKENLTARSNAQIVAPKIKIDLNGVGIYSELPRIVVKDCYDSYLIWEITSDEMPSIVKVDLFRRSGVLVSEEKIITLKPAKSYTFSLMIDDKQISKWEFRVKDDYIAFSQNGNLIKTEHLPNSTVILLLKKNKKILENDRLPIIELPQVPLWEDYNVYKVDLSNVNSLKCLGLTIPVIAEKKPIVDGGRTLFDQENSQAYIVLPYIKVPFITEGNWHIEINHKAGREVISKRNVVVSSNCERILLSSYIPNTAYGEYEIKIWNRSGISGKFILQYVPFGCIQIDENDYWPTNYQGYVKNVHTIRASKSVEIDIYNAEKVFESQHDDYNIHRFIIKEKDRFLIGDYKYTVNGHMYSTSIKKSVYPISWGIVGLNDEVIDLSGRVYTLTLQELSNATNPYILFSFNFDQVYDIQTINIDLIGPDERIIRSNNFAVRNNDGLRMPLNSTLFEIQNTNSAIDFYLRATLFDSKNIPVTSFIIARFQDEVLIDHASYSVSENEIYFTWTEHGACRGRELVLINFLRPWLKPYRYRIEDETCEITVKTANLEEGIYRYIIQKEPDYLFDEQVSEVSSLKDFQKGKIVIKGEKNFSSLMEKILYHLLRTRFMKREYIPRTLAGIKSEIRKISDIVADDINKLANAYILHNRFYLQKDDSTKIMQLFDELFDLFSNYRNAVIKYVLESDFLKEDKKELLHKFHCNNLTTTTKISDYHFKLLTEIDENMAGFFNLIQANNNSKGLNWAGISSIDVLTEADLSVGRTNRTFLTEKNLGKTSYITDFYQYVSECLKRTKNLSKTSAEFYREFEKEKSIQETKIFGKTRLQLLVEWKGNNREADQIQEKLSLVLNIPCKQELKDQFKDAFDLICKRRPVDELGYYVGLIALYASFIRNGLMDETKQFSHLLHYTIETCDKLYYRDAIIIELYMKYERGYSWV